MAEDCGWEFRSNYSGRGMYGETCVGVVCPSASECIEEASLRGIRGASVDNMGRDFIVYWPNIKGNDE